MQILQVTPGSTPALRGASVALGNFDGLHKGHQAVIEAARAAAGPLKAPLGVALFDPHPRRFFQPHGEPFRILSDRVRNRVLEDLGVDVLYRIAFDRALSLMTDAEFAEGVLARALGVRHVAVGWDFAFGRDRMGDGARLGRLGQGLGFGATVVDAVTVDGADCSSTATRAALKAGDVGQAERMMTRPWIIDGLVERGEGRGGDAIGVRTANLPMGEHIRPMLGVYAVTARIDGEGEARPGVANIGRRPTFEGEDERLEVHLFDFSDDLYGRRLEVEVRAFIREERKFDGLEALKAQIALDVAAAKAALGG